MYNLKIFWTIEMKRSKTETHKILNNTSFPQKMHIWTYVFIQFVIFRRL